MLCRIESGAEASSSNSHSTAAAAATHSQMNAPSEQLGRNNNQTSCICGRTDILDTTLQCEVVLPLHPWFISEIWSLLVSESHCYVQSVEHHYLIQR